MKRLISLVVLLWTAPTAIAQNAAVEPPHVYQAIQQLAADIELVRQVMGRPKLEAPAWIVDFAEPRHVFYQVQTLFRTVNRLSLQFTEEETELPSVPFGEIEPHHVLAVVKATHARIGRVREELAMNYRAEMPAIDMNKKPRDVLREAVQASRQVNLMLDRPIRPDDVYDRLRLASAYVAGALTEEAESPSYGTLPPFESGKVPADVYRRVLECLRIAQEIGKQREIPVLQLDLRRELRRRDIAPSDVYHLAMTVLAELAYLTLRLDAKDVDLPPLERPRHIFPAHVFQIAGMLQNELARLETRLAQ